MKKAYLLPSALADGQIIIKNQIIMKETASTPKIKTCPACKKQFECLHNADCWCMNYKLSKEQLDMLRAKYNDCICEECMRLFSRLVV